MRRPPWFRAGSERLLADPWQRRLGIRCDIARVADPHFRGLDRSVHQVPIRGIKRVGDFKILRSRKDLLVANWKFSTCVEFSVNEFDGPVDSGSALYSRG